MTDESTDEPKSHKPLPKVGMPLLRDELRATRQKQWVTLGIASGLLAVATLAALFWPTKTHEHESHIVPMPGVSVAALDDAGEAEPQMPDADALVENENEESADAPTATDATEPVAEDRTQPQPPSPSALNSGAKHDSAAVPPAAALGTVKKTFGRSISFQAALTTGGCNAHEAQEIIDALSKVLDFRRCHPEDQLTFERDADGNLAHFTYQSDRTHRYEVSRDHHGALHGERVEIPIERIRRLKGGYVTGSLGDALEALGLGRNLAGLFVETFEGKIAFNTQTRAGDSFRVIIDEERIAGEFLRWGTVHAIEYTGARSGKHRAYFFTPHGHDGDYYDTNARAMHGGWLRTPLRYDHISSSFNLRRMHPILHRIMPHNGIDYSAGTGTPVWAAAEGTVSWAGDRGANGNLVSIHHAGGYDSHYAHLYRIAPGIHVGAVVKQHQLIGYVGTTGRSTGPHLHFGLIHNGHAVDPAHELNGPGRPVPSSDMSAFQHEKRQLDTELDHIDLGPAPHVTAASQQASEEILEEEEDEAPAPAPAPRTRAHH